jgi:thymidylate synthase (FAD)
MIRHRSFFFQEFSQRYSQVNQEPVYTKARTQHDTNRQLSEEVHLGSYMNRRWQDIQHDVDCISMNHYMSALQYGIAKEVARKILPEGMTPTRLYMKGSCRSWIHYIEGRTYEGTQLEHRLVAESAKAIFCEQFPTLAKVLYDEHN